MKILIILSYLMSLAFLGYAQCDSKSFNKKNFLPSFSVKISGEEDFNNLTIKQNRDLWFAEIENPESTKFTQFWDSYHENNYHTSHEDFVKHYQSSRTTLMAFQLGPDILNLSSYDIFIVQPLESCFLITRTNISHDRS